MFYQFAHAGHDHGAETTTGEHQAHTEQPAPKKDETSAMSAPLGFGLAFLGLIVVIAVVYSMSSKKRSKK